MKQKTIDIPIYTGKLTMFLDKDLSFIEAEYKTTSLKDYGAVVLNNHRHYIVAFTDKKHLSNIAHEAVHIKNSIFTDCGIQLDLANDEAEAYLVGWLFEQIYEFFNEKNNNTNTI
jgi:hypothetical protein